MAPKI